MSLHSDLGSLNLSYFGNFSIYALGKWWAALKPSFKFRGCSLMSYSQLGIGIINDSVYLFAGQCVTYSYSL